MRLRPLACPALLAAAASLAGCGGPRVEVRARPGASVAHRVAVVYPYAFRWEELLNTNRREDTLECLASLIRSTYSNHKAIVLDNHSAVGSVEAIRSAFPSVLILELEANYGYAGNNNVMELIWRYRRARIGFLF